MRSHKIRLLRRLSESETLGRLSDKALKLYLVLLVAAKRLGREETIDPETVRKALGSDFTGRQALRIGAILEQHGLATVRLSSRARRPGDREETWHFRILGRASGGPDVQEQARSPRAGCGR